LLIVSVILNHSTNKHHFEFKSAIWYWHFVDVVWLFSFLDSSLIAKDYLALFFMLLIAIVLVLVILGLSYFLSKQNPDSEKLSAYDCSFEPYENSRRILTKLYNNYFICYF
jgi:Cytochrome c oxidase subunit III